MSKHAKLTFVLAAILALAGASPSQSEHAFHYDSYGTERIGGWYSMSGSAGSMENRYSASANLVSMITFGGEWHPSAMMQARSSSAPDREGNRVTSTLITTRLGNDDVWVAGDSDTSGSYAARLIPLSLFGAGGIQKAHWVGPYLVLYFVRISAGAEYALDMTVRNNRAGVEGEMRIYQNGSIGAVTSVSPGSTAWVVSVLRMADTRMSPEAEASPNSAESRFSHITEPIQLFILAYATGYYPPVIYTSVIVNWVRGAVSGEVEGS